MKYYFNPSNLQFYLSDVHHTIPKNAVEVSSQVFELYGVGTQPVGKKRGWNGDTVVWVDEETSLQDLVKDARAWRDSELSRADVELYKVQDSDPKSKGSVSDWRNYRKSLRSWPETVNFPNISSRPVAPDA